MNRVSDMWFLELAKGRLCWITSNDSQTKHPLDVTAIGAADFSGHIKVSNKM